MAELTYWAAPTYLLDDWGEKSPEVWGRLVKACLLYVQTGDRELAGAGLYAGDRESFAVRCREIDRARAAIQRQEIHDNEISDKRRDAANARWHGRSGGGMQMHANASEYKKEKEYERPPVSPRRGKGRRKDASQYTEEDLMRIRALETDLSGGQDGNEHE